MNNLKVFITGFLAMTGISATAQVMYEVKAKRVDVFDQPNDSAKVIGRLVEGDILNVYGTFNGWVIIPYKNSTGYVDLFCVRPLDEEEEQPQSAASTQTKRNPIELVLQAGTEIPLRIVRETKAKNVKVGQSIAFAVSQNISVDDRVVIPLGTLVYGKVTEAVPSGKERFKMKSTKGSLKISIENVVLDNGTVVPLSKEEVVGQKKRDVLQAGLFGRVADSLPAGYEIVVKVASPTTFIITE